MEPTKSPLLFTQRTGRVKRVSLFWRVIGWLTWHLSWKWRRPMSDSPDSLYPHSVYQCQNQDCANFGKYFRTGVFRGAVTWNCPTCSKPGKYIGRQCSYCRYVERPEVKS